LAAHEQQGKNKRVNGWKEKNLTSAAARNGSGKEDGLGRIGRWGRAGKRLAVAELY
jgi:hypothetical protein